MWDSDSCSWTIDRQKINYYLEKDRSGGTGGTEMHRCAEPLCAYTGVHSHCVLTELAGGDGSERKKKGPECMNFQVVL